MPTYITVEEQEALDLRRTNSNHITPYTSHDLTATEQGLLSSSLSAASTIMAQRQDSHLARSEDTAVTNAFASLFYSLAYSVAGAFITAGILLIAYYVL